MITQELFSLIAYSVNSLFNFSLSICSFVKISGSHMKFYDLSYPTLEQISLIQKFDNAQ
jgi:hypothetical protein